MVHWPEMIERTLQPHLLELAGRHPVITLTGPRQSGKTTLCRMAFPDHSYVSLENPAQREYAVGDPVGFLAGYPDGAIFDEVQRAPELPSFLQGMVDEDPRPGRFILTGSRNLALLDTVSQSLAGRTAVLELLPLGLDELRRFPEPPTGLFETIWTGGYPRIHEHRLPAGEWLASYTTTYLERDARDLLKIGDLLLFQTFLRLAAGRTGQLLNLSSLAADCGISQSTARAWLSVLEASYLAFRLPPFHTNLGKRLIKTPKLYFYDVGLVCNLLGITEPRQLDTHPLRGALFESWAITEIAKYHHHRGRRPRLYFYRDRSQLEVDLLIEQGADLVAVEMKSAQTASSSFFTPFDRLADRLGSGGAPLRLADRIVLYGGDETQRRSAGHLLPWSRICDHPWTASTGRTEAPVERDV